MLFVQKHPSVAAFTFFWSTANHVVRTHACGRSQQKYQKKRSHVWRHHLVDIRKSVSERRILVSTNS